jgi:hypothetical protein
LEHAGDAEVCNTAEGKLPENKVLLSLARSICARIALAEALLSQQQFRCDSTRLYKV